MTKLGNFKQFINESKTNRPMNESTSTDLAKFGSREISKAADLLNAWVKNGLPEDFYDDGVTLMMNHNSGEVFLTNSDYQVAMVDGGELYSFYTTPSGNEGSFEDLLSYDFDNMDDDDKEYLLDIAKNLNKEDEFPKKYMVKLETYEGDDDADDTIEVSTGYDIGDNTDYDVVDTIAEDTEEVADVLKKAKIKDFADRKLEDKLIKYLVSKKHMPKDAEYEFEHEEY